jgi:hypothetical protein
MHLHFATWRTTSHGKALRTVRDNRNVSQYVIYGAILFIVEQAEGDEL